MPKLDNNLRRQSAKHHLSEYLNNKLQTDKFMSGY